jgi:hypothetical protein
VRFHVILSKKQCLTRENKNKQKETSFHNKKDSALQQTVYKLTPNAAITEKAATPIITKKLFLLIAVHFLR